MMNNFHIKKLQVFVYVGITIDSSEVLLINKAGSYKALEVMI